MKSILSNSFLTLLTFTSLISSSFAAPGHVKSGSNDAKTPIPKFEVNATAAATFIPTAPYFVAYPDSSTGGQPPDPSTLTVCLLLTLFISVIFNVLH
jgi:hypothetical protein